MLDRVEALRKSALKEIQEAVDSVALEKIKVRYLGRKGPIQELMQELKGVPAEQKPALGKLVNDVKQQLQTEIEQRLSSLFSSEEKLRLQQETIDVTAPGRRRLFGNKHVISRGMDKILRILSEMGFTVQYGPDIDTDYYNFEALNFAEDHPARDMQDTYYIEPKVVLRTHTTNIQVRLMEEQGPPFRIAAPGKVYRNETISSRSHVFFHQVDFFYIDRKATFADLLSTFDVFLKRFFHQDVEIRYRPSYFPFVEPGMEVDIRCLNCNGGGCSLCKHTGWLEVAGAGMMHPEVLKGGGIDPEEWIGFAAGMGVERMVMLKHEIRDIRAFTENNLKFLEQFT